MQTALQDTFEDIFIRYSAANALGALQDPRAYKPLLFILTRPPSKDPWGNSGSEQLRAGAAEALGVLGNKEASDALIATLASSSSNVRRSCAAALGRLGEVRAVDQLIHILNNDREFVVRNSAVEALTRIGTPEAIAAVEGWRKKQGNLDS